MTGLVCHTPAVTWPPPRPLYSWLSEWHQQRVCLEPSPNKRYRRFVTIASCMKDGESRTLWARGWGQERAQAPRPVGSRTLRLHVHHCSGTRSPEALASTLRATHTFTHHAESVAGRVPRAYPAPIHCHSRPALVPLVTPRQTRALNRQLAQRRWHVVASGGSRSPSPRCIPSTQCT